MANKNKATQVKEEQVKQALLSQLNLNHPAPLYELAGEPEGQKSVYIEVCPEGVDWHITYPLAGVPSRFWHGVCKAILVPIGIRRDALVQLIERIAPLLARAVDGAAEWWDGSNYVGAWSEDAIDALAAAESIAEEYWMDLVDTVDPEEAVFGSNPATLKSLYELYPAELVEAAKRGEPSKLAQYVLEDVLEEGYIVIGGEEAIARAIQRVIEEEE